jgi:hypothetical protein
MSGNENFFLIPLEKSSTKLKDLYQARTGAKLKINQELKITVEF